jgi:predicted PurR-regulated permease PerM
VITYAENTFDSLITKGLNFFKTNVSNIFSGALTTLKSAGNVLINFALGLIIAFIILLEKEKAATEGDAILKKLLSPKAYRRATYVLSLANEKVFHLL